MKKRNISIFKGKKTGKKRRKEIIWMVIATAFLFLGTPLIIHFVSSWNSLTPDPPSFELSKYELADKYWHRDGGNYSIVYEQYSQYWDKREDGYYYEEDIEYKYHTVKYDDNVLWDNDELNSIIVSDVIYQGAPADLRITPWIQRIHFITEWTALDLLENPVDPFIIKFQGDYQERKVYVSLFEEDPYTGVVGPDSEDLFEKNFTGNLSVKVDLETLEIMKANVLLNGKSRLVFTFEVPHIGGSWVIEDYNWMTGDVLKFDITHVEISEAPAQINEFTALKIGSAVMGGSFLIIALVSTSAWNPTEKNNPGYIDKKIKNWANRKKSKKNKKKKKEKGGLLGWLS